MAIKRLEFVIVEEQNAVDGLVIEGYISTTSNVSFLEFLFSVPDWDAILQALKRVIPDSEEVLNLENNRIQVSYSRYFTYTDMFSWLCTEISRILNRNGLSTHIEPKKDVIYTFNSDPMGWNRPDYDTSSKRWGFILWID